MICSCRLNILENIGNRNKNQRCSLDECQGYRQIPLQMPVTFTFPIPRRTARFFICKPMHLYRVTDFSQLFLLLVCCCCVAVIAASTVKCLVRGIKTLFRKTPSFHGHFRGFCKHIYCISKLWTIILIVLILFIVFVLTFVRNWHWAYFESKSPTIFSRKCAEYILFCKIKFCILKCFI